MAQQRTSTIIIYTHPECTYSTAQKEDFRKEGIEYIEIDVTLQPEKIPELEELTGGERITPVVVDGDEVIVGYHGVG